MKAAILCEKFEDGRARCGICPHRCLLRPGRRGICGVRENRDGVICALNYGKLIAIHDDPIEKKPLYHFYPGSRSLSVATVGCNLRCANCQNWQISQWPQDHAGAEIPGEEVTPLELAKAAAASGCRSVSFTYTEPAIFSEYAIDVMKENRALGIRNVFVTNGFMSTALVREISGDLDAANVDLKSSSDDFYKKNCGGRLAPVQDTIAGLWKAGVWVEVTTLLIPGLNDSDADVGGVAAFIAGVSTEIPWHVSRFHPDFRLTRIEPTPEEKIVKAIEIGRKAGLKYIYGGNVSLGSDTVCPCCDTTLIRRTGFSVTKLVIRDGKCPSCGALVSGRWLTG